MTVLPFDPLDVLMPRGNRLFGGLHGESPCRPGCLRDQRNCLAHGSPHRCGELRGALADPQALRHQPEADMKRILE
ncbi:MAG TPA: hypothetical protein DHV08_14985 [Rhodocyclaceae bacterium]|nr:MAG: hypothetical protein COZ38_08715 [Rhodocyclales bacterium CG_4_10_14_3_um_filter_68_10]PJA57886.1 MAG: hypothetical protein CO164_05415 [Rhodocyclales bacterium CG_4_9_14_3_um_filter_68_10]HCX34716.1 hypothetical protein [Rhodocyclaceae bacterium]